MLQNEVDVLSFKEYFDLNKMKYNDPTANKDDDNDFSLYGLPNLDDPYIQELVLRLFFTEGFDNFVQKLGTLCERFMDNIK